MCPLPRLIVMLVVDDSFELLNPLYVPKACPTGSERNDRTLEAE